MKKVFTMACSVALLAIFSFANAQTQNSAMAKVDVKKNVSSPLVTEMPTSSSEVENIITTSTVTVAPFEGFKFKDERAKRSTLNNKVGPNGEEILMINEKFYYLNEKGKKVKIKSSLLQNKPKHS